MTVTISQDLLPGFLSFLLTLMVLSYLIGDNPAFRVAVYIFVGVSAGYVAAVVWWQVIYPKVFIALFSGTFIEALIALLALILGVLLLLKLSARMAWLGDVSGNSFNGGRRLADRHGEARTRTHASGGNPCAYAPP